MKTPEQLRDALLAAQTDFLIFRQGAAMGHFVTMLDLITETYQIELMTIAPEKLQRIQGAIQQVAALRRSIVENDLNVSVTI